MLNQTLAQLYKRKSTRAFREDPIPDSDKQAILLAAAAAPTAGNQQLYTILDITDPELKLKLSESCDHQPFIAKAPLVLIFLADCQKWLTAYGEAGMSPRRPGTGDFLLAVDDALIAAQNAVMAAESLGIASCYIGDIMENIELHREMLSLPETVFPAAMLVMGYPAPSMEKVVKPKRVDMQYIVQENRYMPHTGAQLRDMLRERCGEKGFDAYIQAFSHRKYESDFSIEMSRSVAKALEIFLQ